MNYGAPLASTDGKKLFIRAEVPKGELVRYDSRSGAFVTELPAISPRTVAFSRDGKWIAYSSLADNNLWRCRSEGNACLQLTRGMQQTALPSWSPDGRVIAFMARQFGGNWSIFTVASAGGEVHSLSAGDQSLGDPGWSPLTGRGWFLEMRCDCCNHRKLPRSIFWTCARGPLAYCPTRQDIFHHAGLPMAASSSRCA
jgi:hypothetical protein